MPLSLVSRCLSVNKYRKGILDAFFSQALIRLVEGSDGWKRGGCDQQKSNKASLTKELTVSLVRDVIELTKLDDIIKSIAGYPFLSFRAFTLNSAILSPTSPARIAGRVKVSASAIHRVCIKR